MPKQTGKSSLAGKLGQVGAKAALAHQSDETKFQSGGDLPPIENGVAKVVMCKFAEYEKGDMKGEYYYMARAIVVEPQEYKGLATVIGPEPMCATPTRSRKTVEDHIDFVMNEFRKLGIETNELTIEDFEDTAKTIQDAGIYTRFRTWKGSKQEIIKKNGKFYVGDKVYSTEEAAKKANPYVGTEPRTNHDWRGIAEGYEDSSDEGVEDETGDEEEVEEESEEAEEESTEVETSEGDTDDSESAESLTDELGTLAEKADEGDKKAKKQLTDKAKEAGVDEEEIENADNWQAVAQMIRDASESEEGEETEEESEEEDAEEETEEEWKPAKEEVYKYKMADPKTKKAKKIEVEVLSVNEKSETVTLKDLDTAKTILNKDKKPLAVKWTDLIRDE